MLKIENLWVSIDGIEVLRGLSLHVPRGAVVALVGRNGAGKTTTLRAVMGFVPVSRGSILLDGNVFNSLPAHARARGGIGYAPEDRRLIAGLSVEENLLLPLEACGEPASMARERLTAVYDLLPELAPLRDREVSVLSGGQQKIAALGRAAMVGKHLLLLDEPFQGLAAGLASRYAEALIALCDRGLAEGLLVTESNDALLRPIADKTYTLERGEILSDV